jgi:hypothetical protein
MFNNGLKHQYNTLRIFSQRWFGSYVVVTTYDNATYTLRELNGTMLKIPIVGKWIKTFRRRDSRIFFNDVADFEIHEVDEVEEVDLETSEDENLHKFEEE